MIGVKYLSTLFVDISNFTETFERVACDRKVEFNSKSLVLFQNDNWCLKKGRLPDLRFQNVSIQTKIQK